MNRLSGAVLAKKKSTSTEIFNGALACGHGNTDPFPTGALRLRDRSNDRHISILAPIGVYPHWDFRFFK